MKRLSNDKGFTLLEVLLTLAILSIGILATSGLAVYTVKGNHKANDLTRATVLAQDRVEAIRTAGYDSALTFVATENYGSVDGQGRYKRITAVTDATPQFGMRTVTVTVQWESGAHDVVLTTIIAKQWAS